MTDSRMPRVFHTGLIVHDLEQAMRDYGRAFGYTFAEPAETSSMLQTPRGLLPRRSIATFTLEGPHRLELIQQVDPTAWAAAEGGPRLHHLGYWVDDLAAESARLIALGFRQQIHGLGDDGGIGRMSYHVDPNGGLYLELVDRALEAGMEQWFAGHVVPTDTTLGEPTHVHTHPPPNPPGRH
jgi:hypothetical protein